MFDAIKFSKNKSTYISFEKSKKPANSSSFIPEEQKIEEPIIEFTPPRFNF